MKSSRLKYRYLGRLLYFFLSPALRVYLNKRLTTRLLIFNEGKFLVVKNFLSNGSLGLPGGGLRKKELPYQALLREVEEEINLVLFEKDISYKGLFLAKNGITRYRYHLWFSQISPLKVADIKVKSFEILDLEWVDLKKINSMKLSSELSSALEVWQKTTGLLK